MHFKEEEKNYSKLFDALYGIGLVLFGALLTIVFYRQSIRYNGRYPADTQYYVDTAKAGEGVRMISYVFRWLYKMTGTNWSIAVYMALVVVATVLVNYVIIKYFLDRDGYDVPRVIAQAASFVMIFSGSIYLPKIYPFFYKKSWSTYAWHSPTQHTMMLFALISILLFFMIYEKYTDRVNPGLWILLLFTSLLSTWAKPSFILAMTPTVIILFLIELFTRTELSFAVRLRKLITFGLAFVPSGLLAIWLSMTYFGEGDMAEGGEMAFGISHFLESNTEQLAIKIACGLAFPLIVYLFNLRRFKDFRFRTALILLIMSTVEWMLIYEEGSRAAHGNFSWGKKMGCYIFFLCSLPLAVENWHDEKFLGGSKPLRFIYFLLLACVLAAMLLSQFYYFYAIVRGHTYNF